MWLACTFETRTTVRPYWLGLPSSLFHSGDRATALRFSGRALITNKFVIYLEHLGSTPEYSAAARRHPLRARLNILRGASHRGEPDMYIATDCQHRTRR